MMSPEITLRPHQSLQAYIGLACLGTASFVAITLALNGAFQTKDTPGDDDAKPFVSSPLVLDAPARAENKALTPSAPKAVSPLMSPRLKIPAAPKPAISLTPLPVVKKTTQQTVDLKSGDTLDRLLKRQGIVPEESLKITQAFGKAYSIRKLKAGHSLILNYTTGPKGERFLEALHFRPSLETMVVVERTPSGAYKGKTTKVVLEKEMRRVSGLINASLFGSMMNRGVSPAVINTLIHAYSYDIDFQRDVQADDSFEVVVERYYDPQTGAERAGDVVYASLNVSGKDYKLYAFQPKNKPRTFYNENGVGIEKAFLRTPVDGGRIGSGFGHRKHPVLGFMRMHKGVDFPAPIGTPIFCAGDGVVERVGRFGGYGNYVRIRHANGFSTAYAHLSKFGAIRPGSVVKQGHVLGYVGTTGVSTGPHLHYEVLKNGVQINPKSMVNTSLGIRLVGQNAKRFKELKTRISRQLAGLRKSETVLAQMKRPLTGAGKKMRRA